MNMKINVLIACEKSGRTRRAMRALGINAYSCDIELADDGNTEHHYLCAVEDILQWRWDLIIAHPPCTYLSGSGLHWNKNDPERQAKTVEAIKFVEEIWNAPNTERLMIENPIGCLSTKSTLGEPTQFIQPYEYGEDACKRTCLWHRGLPMLVPTEFYPPRWVLRKDGRSYVQRWSNQGDEGHSRLGPSEDRAEIRSITYQGWADAWADQWGRLLL